MKVFINNGVSRTYYTDAATLSVVVAMWEKTETGHAEIKYK